MKRFLIFLCSLLFIGFVTFFINNPRILTNDSGFDFSYGGGFSSSHGSSTSSSSSSGDDKFTMFHIYFISFVIIDCVVGTILLKIKNKKNYKIGLKFKILLYLFLYLITFLFLCVDLSFKNITLCIFSFGLVAVLSFFNYICVLMWIVGDKKVNVLTEEEIIKIDSTIDYDKFINQLFEIYKNVQIGWMNFDYEKLREFLSDELYNQYKMQLDILKVKNQKNIMNDIKFKLGGIVSIDKKDTTETIVAFLQVSMYDYIVDHSGKVVRGNKCKRVNASYYITLERGYEVLSNCPQCGAEVLDRFSQKCKYCNSTIVKTGSDFVMTKKKIIGQW